MVKKKKKNFFKKSISEIMLGRLILFKSSTLLHMYYSVCHEVESMLAANEVLYLAK